ncbi:hypothetical protein QBC39DRAFT_335018 [Podospora conica]|nr:hypothetical protein QBC39DRAFT_335018 [Schizothecium conicum]
MLTPLLLLTLWPTALAAASCTRASLKSSTDALLAALKAGDPSLLTPASPTLRYDENFKPATLATGILSRPLPIDHARSLLDTTQCATYTEIVSVAGPAPYVLGVQLWRDAADGATLSHVDALVTTTGDWLFNATGTLRWASREDWGEIPAEKRDSRDVIRAGADAYLDIFSDKTVVVPWGKPCARLEGGAYTGSGGPNDRCDVGIPEGVKLVNRRYVIDEVVGAVDVFLQFASLADSHEFRFEGGRLRFVHTITPMGGNPGPGGGKGKGKAKARRTR